MGVSKKKKLNVFSVFKEFKVQVELEYEIMIKCLRTNNDREYRDNKFLVFYKYEGIERRFTVTYTPQ